MCNPCKDGAGGNASKQMKQNGGNQFANGALEHSEIYSGTQTGGDALDFRKITSKSAPAAV